ncbi:MAG: hypothetical protein ACKOBG_11210 [Actinomycetota bacterium]
MERRRPLLLVVVAGAIAAGIAQAVAPDGPAPALLLLAAGLVAGEILVLRLEDRSALPLSYAVLIVIAASFPFAEYAAAVVGAEAISLVLRLTDRGRGRRVAVVVERLAVATATYAAYAGAHHVFPGAETVATVLAALVVAAAAQPLVAVPLRLGLRLGSSITPRGRLAWIAIGSSGVLMAIGYHGVDGAGRVGLWGPLIFATPLLAAWYAFERLDAATRSFRQTIEALAMAPELGGYVADGHAARVTALAGAVAERMGLPTEDVRDLEMAALLHHLGQVTLDDPDAGDPGEVAVVTGTMMRDIRPLAAAGDIVAGDASEPRRRLAARILAVASAFDDLMACDASMATSALAVLRADSRYAGDARVLAVVERVLRDRSVGALVPASGV